MPLRKFRSFIQDHGKSGSTRSERTIQKQGTDDADITDAATVIIGSDLSRLKDGH
jgi:hypothetical protein